MHMLSTSCFLYIKLRYVKLLNINKVIIRRIKFNKNKNCLKKNYKIMRQIIIF